MTTTRNVSWYGLNERKASSLFWGQALCTSIWENLFNSTLLFLWYFKMQRLHIYFSCTYKYVCVHIYLYIEYHIKLRTWVLCHVKSFGLPACDHRYRHIIIFWMFCCFQENGENMYLQMTSISHIDEYSYLIYLEVVKICLLVAVNCYASVIYDWSYWINIIRIETWK